MTNIQRADIGEAGVQDIFRATEAAQTQQGRMLGQAGAFGEQLAQAPSRYEAAYGELMGATQQGQLAFDRAQADLRTRDVQATADYENLLRMVAGAWQDVQDINQKLVNNVHQMTGETRADLVNQAATSVAQFMAGTAASAANQASAARAEMTAAGVPATQVQQQTAEILNAGRQQGMMASQQFMNTQTELLNQSKVQLTSLNAQANMAAAASQNAFLQTGLETATQAAQIRQNALNTTASLNAGLAQSAADFRARMGVARADLNTALHATLLGGQFDLFNMLAQINEPYIQIAPLLGSMFNLNMQTAILESDAALQDWGIQSQVIKNITDTLVGGFTTGMGLQMQYESMQGPGQNDMAMVVSGLSQGVQGAMRGGAAGGVWGAIGGGIAGSAKGAFEGAQTQPGESPPTDL
jgi:hypothetical protein